MKLLFDHNLSPRLVQRLADVYPESCHVSAHRLERCGDREVWEFARQHHLLIVTKDSDFQDLSILYGFPPKVIWVQLGNCTTGAIETLLREHHEVVEAFGADSDAGVLLIS